MVISDRGVYRVIYDSLFWNDIPDAASRTLHVAPEHEEITLPDHSAEISRKHSMAAKIQSGAATDASDAMKANNRTLTRFGRSLTVPLLIVLTTNHQSYSSWFCKSDSTSCSTLFSATMNTGSPTVARYNLFTPYYRHAALEYSTPGLFVDVYNAKTKTAEDGRDDFRWGLTSLVQIPATIAAEYMRSDSSISAKLLGFALVAPNSSLILRPKGWFVGLSSTQDTKLFWFKEGLRPYVSINPGIDLYLYIFRANIAYNIPIHKDEHLNLPANSARVSIDLFPWIWHLL